MNHFLHKNIFNEQLNYVAQLIIILMRLRNLFFVNKLSDIRKINSF